jgi:PEP-CTERM motif
MRKFLLSLVCVLVVVGVASMGHAGLFGIFGGSGGGGKGGHGGSSGPPPGLFKFDFHQFGVKPNTDGRDSNNSVSDPFGDYLKLPEIGSNHFGWNHDDGGPNFGHLGIDSGSIGNWQQGNVGGTANPVPEPASMLLFGTGSIIFGGYLRRKFKK